MSTIPRPYEKTTIRGGHTLDELTNYALYAVEYELGYTRGSLTVVQGSYNAGGVAQSAGTHDGGGAVDLIPTNWEKKVKALRKVGFAAWHRTPDQGPWAEHIHCILIGDAKMSMSAFSQVIQYKAKPPTDGLAFHRRDPTWHPDPIPTFQMPALPVPKRRVFHVHKGQYYYTEDSFRGVKFALAKHYGWIDLDCHVTSDGVLIIAHGPRPLAKNTRGGFHDPEGKIDPKATYEQLTWEEVSRLRSAKSGYHVWRADELVPIALEKGLKVELELKSTKITQKQLGDLRDVLSDQSLVQVKALPQFYPALEHAYAAGYKTIILGRNARIPANAQPYITYRRGRVNWS
jgi:hypothetical protein